ncbi:LANO_0A02432g1_1 [Lachancea nothofagi CBS 11611]|uniref:Mediator of RNA polymerase II transcription subunit 9 n=1 Tax=Lachancea nothofagi CBS 11611 TaxID=1266666 RepID=A0A1G4IP26_9SACH|nr:LANO_0A02432g1_1 [Lachancea nothofagi CBS 11611]
MNPQLAQIESLLVPNSHQSSPSIEFIPQLYYALHQLKKDPNSSTNSLDAATLSIRHRLKQCKAHLAENDECRELLSQTPAEWDKTLTQRQNHLDSKREVFRALEQQVQQL